MPQISVEELYRGEGGGAKYRAGGIMRAVMKDFLLHGFQRITTSEPGAKCYSSSHTLAVAEQMKNEGDFVSGMIDAEPPSYHGEGRDENS